MRISFQQKKENINVPRQTYIANRKNPPAIPCTHEIHNIYATVITEKRINSNINTRKRTEKRYSLKINSRCFLPGYIMY